MPSDMIVKALGQTPLLEIHEVFPGLQVDRGKLLVDPVTRATSVAKVFAAGDCTRGGGEVVDAVQDGKLAARGIDGMLKRQ